MNTLLAAPVSLGTETVASFPAPDLHTTGTLPSIPRAEILPQTSAHPSGRYEWDGQQAIAEGYAHFIHQQWYSDLNQHLVKFAPVATAGELVDLGCGPGTNFGLLAPAAKIYAIDISHEMITLAKAASASHSKPAQEIICLVGSGQDLSAMLPNSVNQVYIFNALHLHADPLETLKQAYDSLLPGGQLAFNVGFTRDSVTREYLPEMLRMIRAIREAAVERLPELEFGHEKRLMAGFTCAQYADMARVAGFVDLQTDRREVAVPAEALIELYNIPGFGRELLPDHPNLTAAIRSEILVNGIKNGIRRDWFYCLAQKPS